MLAIAATGTLTIADLASLKRAPSSLPSCLSLIHAPTASAWSPDNTSLYIASSNAIHRYDTHSNSLTDVYSLKEEDSATHLVVKDKTILIFSISDKIHVLECESSSSKISQTIDSHKSPITSLSLSNDSTLLASSSANAVHVHNLSLGSHIVLRGLASLSGQAISTCVFHPHSRTRLLVGAGRQLIVYDTTRPSGPLKSITMNEGIVGDIVSVACSPFSKTLVAASTTRGHVALMDLEKEKSLVRNLNMKAPLTSLVFSPEGGAIYLGTEGGKLLIMDLRGLDKPPKTIVINESGSRIETMTVQKKTKSAVDPVTKSTPAVADASRTPVNVPRRTSVTTQAQTGKIPSKAVPSPAKPRVPRVNSGSSPAVQRVPSSLKESAGVGPPLAKTRIDSKKVFSPVRDPLGNSPSTGDISASGSLKGTKSTPMKKPTSPLATRTRLSSSRAQSISTGLRVTRTTADGEVSRRPRTLPTMSTSSRARKTSTTSNTESISAINEKLSIPASVASESISTHARSRAVSSTSRSESVSTRSAHTTSGRTSSTSRPSSSASTRRQFSSTSSVPPVPPLPEHISTARKAQSRTPSPDLPDMNSDPVTPLPIKKNSMGVLGLGTPELDAWINAGNGRDATKSKGKSKVVGFRDDDLESDNTDKDGWLDDRERELSMQISPQRVSTTSKSASQIPMGSQACAPSPLRQAPGTGGAAHDLLRTIVKDAMLDFQVETRAEMVGLHLDLLRMGRGWKKELRSLMDEYVGDLREMREENARLREENERLRRDF
ncbi:WD40-repeat-containing domain protein [Crucibulum laeve]|uniref:WD40-repeat-containing domain protein n=1 Tax=Crucibulum laeve TaxID=68775 RepID=A0A5C3MTU9_9AGAR|nr:WD40-repeat-containing domain protein [Crucibulum laeve]